MSYLHICPLSTLDVSLREHQPQWMMSLSGPRKTPERPAQVSSGFLALEFNDIGEEREGLIAPNAEHVDEILAFGRQWDRASPLLIHCWMGISRSTAAALLLLAQDNPARDMNALAQRVRNQSPMATPNPLMISLGDAALGLGGSLIDAVAAIGRGADAYEGTPFSLTMQA